MISVVVPVYNEEKALGSLLRALAKEKDVETIIVDGESSDGSCRVARAHGVKLVSTRRMRAHQINEGVRAARGEVIWILHADCVPGTYHFQEISRAIKEGYIGGCFRQKIDGRDFFYRLIETSGNLRAAYTGVYYGDQGVFVKKNIFFSIGGVEEIALFDDVLFSRKLTSRYRNKTKVINSALSTSCRRWHKQGIVKTTVLNWLLTLGFLLNVSPLKLKKFYGDIR